MSLPGHFWKPSRAEIEENRKIDAIGQSASGPRGRPSRPLLLNPTIVGSWIFCAAARRGPNPKGYLVSVNSSGQSYI